MPDGALVHYYDESVKLNSKHEAVLDYDLPGIDLEQCADVVMHLYAEYLYSQGRYDEIGFHFVNGFYCDFATWAQGKRPNVNGEEVTWLQSAQPDCSRESFENYLRIVYAYSSTLSLEKELIPVAPEELAVGDVFIKGGSPGHVVIVVDMAVNKSTGEKRFMRFRGICLPSRLILLKIYLKRSLVLGFRIAFRRESWCWLHGNARWTILSGLVETVKFRYILCKMRI